jgi:MSHA biogenesis protein MshO
MVHRKAFLTTSKRPYFRSCRHPWAGVFLSAQRGFTLLEMVLVIVIMGVIGAIISVFLRSPIDAYFASVRRAAMTDTADITVRRIARDIRRALPNSIRINDVNTCIEFIPTKIGARYRADVDAIGGGNILSFNAADTSFNMLGSNLALPQAQRIGAGDVIVVYNLGLQTGSDAYRLENTAVVSDAHSESGDPVETKITISEKQFPFSSASQRFHVIPAAEKVVAYFCDSGKLYRKASQSISSVCAANTVLTGKVLANDMKDCKFEYDDADQSNALVQLNFRLQDTASGESISLYHEIHVSNTP